METTDAYLVGVSALLTIGLSGLALRRSAAHRLLAVNVSGTAIMLGLGTIARRGSILDPLPHAFVLTGLVLTVTATALGLILVWKADNTDRADSTDSDEP